MARHHDPQAVRKFLTRNERYHANHREALAVAVVVSVGLHMALFQFFPTLTAASLESRGEEVTVVQLPPEVRIPPPPQHIVRPAMPRVAAAEALAEDITIAPTTFEHNPVERLPSPPSTAKVDVRDQPVYVARDIEPRLKNGSEIEILLSRLYPRMLKEAGIGGTTVLWVFIDTDGRAGECRIHKSSGYAALDDTAEQIAHHMVFSPALHRAKPVAVWIAQPIEFRINAG